MELFVYNENCALAGRQVPQSAIQDHGEDCADWHAEEVSEENADWHAEQQRGPYHWRIAATIREALR